MSSTDNQKTEKNTFDKASDFVKSQKEDAMKNLEDVKGQAGNKVEEAKKAAQEGWENFTKSEAEKKEAGEKTIGDNIGGFIDTAKDATGKAINDAKAKVDEALSGDKKD